MKITGTIKSAHFGTFEIDIDTDKPPDPEPKCCRYCGLPHKGEGSCMQNMNKSQKSL